MKVLSKLLILLIISTGMGACATQPAERMTLAPQESVASGEEIYKPYEKTNIAVTLFLFDTLEEMQDYRFEKFGEELGLIEPERDILGFSGSEPYTTHDFCHLDMYVVRPTLVDDEETSTIGHEFLHCVYGPDYHRP